MLRAPCAAVLIAACGGGSATMDAAGDSTTLDAGQRLVAYVSGYGPDIAWLAFDPTTGQLTPGGAIAAAQGTPSFLALTARHVYAVSESASRAVAYAIDPASGALSYVDDVDSGGSGPAHITAAGDAVLVANYGGGTVAVLPIRPDGGLAAPRQVVAAGANAHMIVLDAAGGDAFVPCKGADAVAQYRFTGGALVANGAVATADGAGPRHLAFAPDGAHAYLINENASTLTVLAYDAARGQLSPQQTVSTRAAGATGANTGAEVWVHPSGRFVYGSNRGDDNIAVFAIAASGAITLAGHVATGGRTPRSFSIDPSGRWLLAANQDSNSVVTFAIDAATGLLAPTGASLVATRPAFVGFVALP